MIEIQQIQARAIAQLAQKIEPFLTDSKSVLVGIVTDGVPVARGIRYALWQKSKPCKIDYLGASSKDRWWVDHRKLEILKAASETRVYVDWRTKTGTLRQMLELVDPGSTYAVLSNPNNQQNYFATTEDVPKFKFHEDYEEKMKTIGIWVEPHTLEEAIMQGQEYYEIETDASMEFYANLFQEIKKFLPE